ncbi:DUF305 domain-containing protein [Bradyrhizobium vignae]|uniref:DUF305 domain-containing protein n=1 Tax=Bradyrhizobium vignae TaxID=1549949 RepID=UPI00100A4DBA|nr:DUF305 domain-containing protein [Bradyrhizobium vignae]RXG86213.1 DUF305 domain-containing protein [Bradyrhizobium vignae]
MSTPITIGMVEGGFARVGAVPISINPTSEFDVTLFSRGFVRRRVISLATSLSVMATSFALAQAPKHPGQPRDPSDTDEQQFLFENDLAMSNMNRGMLIKPSGDVDRDFVALMIPHHQGAVDMARAEIKYGHNGALRTLAQKIVSQQEQEISALRGAFPTPVTSNASTRVGAASASPN